MTERISSYDRHGLTFDVRDSGPLDGPVAVLLHGFPQTSTSWAAVSAHLNERGVRTIAPDQRGYSPGARPKGRYSYRGSELAADVVALLRQLGRPVHLVGHDWGSAVAWSVAGGNPDLLASLTAVSVPHPAAFLRSMLRSSQALHSWYMAAFQIPLLPELSARRRPEVFDAMLRHSRMTDEHIATTRREIVDSGALPFAINWYRGMPFAGPASLANRIQVPTTMVWSDGDEFITRRSIELTADYVSGPYKLDVLPGVSHWIPEEKPAELADAVCNRIERGA
ncbi:alpha/beta fold hydrolase [Tsukamurella sp. 8F]|uniref:alpha/beta fold hydrolase n=1 Tax=unclassified Tsukamurella TaxID=2633480 RepID=UPI0023B9DEBD|nr:MULTISPECIES: alpha/beta fold hydrolase [unclassified Tsukamurella]MDF0529927.1 alpha/beta fold hydrolase [Tsukamurella sp. 8J]MDF0587301.1 alpha/beta fold hydrolase [Tsukamurella sp. 8F]